MVPERVGAQREHRTQVERRSEAVSKLLRSAMELIAQRGIERTSPAEIGQRAGFSRGLVNHHFGTKVELIKRLIWETQREFVQSEFKDVRGNGLECVLGLVDRYLRKLTRFEPIYQSFLVMWAESAGGAHELRPSFIEGDRRFREGLRELVDRGVHDGSIRADVKPPAMAAWLVAQLRGLGLELLVDVEGFDLDEMRADILAAISAALSPNARR